MCNYSENWTVAPLRGLSVDFALLLFWFSKQAIIESGTGATPHGPAGAELAGAGPFPNGRVTDTAALRITEMDFIVRMQDSPWIEILPVDDFAAQTLCPHMDPHFPFGHEYLADPGFPGCRKKKIGHPHSPALTMVAVTCPGGAPSGNSIVALRGGHRTAAFSSRQPDSERSLPRASGSCNRCYRTAVDLL